MEEGYFADARQPVIESICRKYELVREYVILYTTSQYIRVILLREYILWILVLVHVRGVL
jgi:hypothetical protein